MSWSLLIHCFDGLVLRIHGQSDNNGPATVPPPVHSVHWRKPEMAAAGGGADEGFEWPWQYNFPPFFTLQPNAETRAKQVSAWSELICAYCAHRNTEVLVIAEAASTLPLFVNSKLNRSLSHADIVTIIDEMKDVKPNHCEWLDEGKERCLVMWKTAQQWASELTKWVSDTGQSGTVCTLYEIREGDAVGGAQFKGVGDNTLRKAIEVLEAQGRATLIRGDDVDSDGVKFL